MKLSIVRYSTVPVQQSGRLFDSFLLSTWYKYQLYYMYQYTTKITHFNLSEKSVQTIRKTIASQDSVRYVITGNNLYYCTGMQYLRRTQFRRRAIIKFWRKSIVGTTPYFGYLGLFQQKNIPKYPLLSEIVLKLPYSCEGVWGWR